MELGLRAHGVDVFVNAHVDADLYCFWSHRWPDVIQRAKALGVSYLVGERGYIDRHRYCSLGFDGLNGLARFAEPGAGARHEYNMKPQHDGDYWLIMGQINGDESLRGMDINEWAADVYAQLQDVTDLPIYYRPHPQRAQRNPDIPLLQGDLETALAGAHAVVTFNSNSGVDAVLAGCRVVTYDRGSMAWDVSTHSVRDVPQHFDRQAWADALTWKQWTLDEIESGEAWEHVKNALLD